LPSSPEPRWEGGIPHRRFTNNRRAPPTVAKRLGGGGEPVMKSTTAQDFPSHAYVIAHYPRAAVLRVPHPALTFSASAIKLLLRPNLHCPRMTTSETTILLCSDLDRTLLPNGPQPESPQVRALLRRVAERPEIKLAYVSGRHRELLREAIDSYQLPEPDYAITDVGTRIYTNNDGHWQVWDAWEAEIGPDWNGKRHDELAMLFADLSPLTLQETEKQNIFKLSYYVELDTDRSALLEDMSLRLTYAGVRANLIWSVDELEHVGLLDILPASANKLHAIRFLIDTLHIPASRTLFAGDSGNDLAVLTSGMQSVLVANAAPDVREAAVQAVREGGHRDSLYLAMGSFFDMNGNYAAGVLEGLAHFFPETAAWLRNKDAVTD